MNSFKNVFSKSFSEIVKNKIDKLDKKYYDDRILFFIEFISSSIVNKNNKFNYKNCFEKNIKQKENKEKLEVDIEKLFNKYISDNYKIEKFLSLNSNSIPELIEVSVYDVFENKINLKKIVNLLSFLYIKERYIVDRL